MRRPIEREGEDRAAAPLGRERTKENRGGIWGRCCRSLAANKRVCQFLEWFNTQLSKPPTRPRQISFREPRPLASTAEFCAKCS